VAYKLLPGLPVFICEVIKFSSSFIFSVETFYIVNSGILYSVTGIGGEFLLNPWSRVLLEKLTSKLCT